jgi:hypothetical protein
MVLVPASALLFGQLALMVSNLLGALNQFGVSVRAHLGRMVLVKRGRLLVYLGRTVVSPRCALVRSLRPAVAAGIISGVHLVPLRVHVPQALPAYGRRCVLKP